jgi:uncharacterized protein YdeI (YjbR/CyaY-like superfamily)
MKIAPRSRQSWRAWLDRNHADKTQVWLVFYKRHTRKPTLSYDDAVEEALCFGWIDGVRRSIDDERYMHRFSPRKSGSRWSELNKERAERMLKAGRMAPAGRRAIQAAKRGGKWSETRPTTDFSMPPELAARLRRNKRATAFFAALAPSYQRQYVAWIATAKRQETKERRLNEAIELLTRGKKLGMR